LSLTSAFFIGDPVERGGPKIIIGATIEGIPNFKHIEDKYSLQYGHTWPVEKA
jgi:hypothetical protein